MITLDLYVTRHELFSAEIYDVAVSITVWDIVELKSR
jgi:hypothetical protein